MARLRSALNAPQGSAPPGHGKWKKPAEMENQQLRVGQVRVSKVGQVRLSNAGGTLPLVVQFGPARPAAPPVNLYVK